LALAHEARKNKKRRRPQHEGEIVPDNGVADVLLHVVCLAGSRRWRPDASSYVFGERKLQKGAASY
jgi:hypothetical protein